MKKTFTFACMAKKKALCLILAAFCSANTIHAVEYAPDQGFPTSGNLNVLCVLAELKGTSFPENSSEYYRMWNEHNYNSYGSVNDYYLQNSYGALNVKAKIVGPYKMKKRNKYDSASELMMDVLGKLKKEKSINFSEFDQNGDKRIDVIYVIYSDKESVDFTITNSWLSNEVELRDGYKARRFFLSSCYSPIADICKGLGRVLGAPDFFTNGTRFLGTGSYDIMGYNDGRTCPTHHNPYTKAYIYKWVAPEEIEPSVKNKKYILRPSHKANSFYRINTSIPNEFFLLENKVQATNSFNQNIPQSGMLIYHVHKDI